MTENKKLIAIINASPLIFLGKIGALNYLTDLFSKIYTTTEVKEEVLRKKNAPEQNILKIALDSWIELKNYKNIDLYQNLQSLNIHKGESSIIVLATEINSRNILILDDLASRDIAKSLNLSITGTIGILLKAAKKKIIDKEECINFVKRLILNTDFRISSKVYIKLLDELNKI